MIEVVNNKSLEYIQGILLKEFNVKYSKNDYSKEYVYILNNEILGFIIYEYIYDRIELDYIYVDKEKRGIGIANILMNQMIGCAKENNIKNSTVEVNKNNFSAISLYKKYGFIDVAVRKGYYNGEDALLMIRE